MPPDAFGRANLRLPSEQSFGFFIRIAVSPVIDGAELTIESRRQLSLRPRGVFFPKPGRRVKKRVRNAQRSEIAHLLFERAQELAASWQVIINDVQDLTLNAVHYSCHHHSLRA